MIDMEKLKKLFDKVFFGLFGYSYQKEDYLKKIDEVKVTEQEPKVYSIEKTEEVTPLVNEKPKTKRKRSPRKKKTQTPVL